MAGLDQFDTTKLCGAPTERGYNQTTASGYPFWSADPRPEDIRVYDIASQLARICRFNGALRDDVEHYSVAQHCVLVSRHVPARCALEALLHDAAEAYVGDMTKPVKQLFPTRGAVEDRIDHAIRQRFNLPAVPSPEIKEADFYAVATERRDLCNNLGFVDWGPMPEPWPHRIIPLRSRDARSLFLRRYEELGGVL